MAMKLGVISDTHIRYFSELPQNLLKALEKVDLIIHAGDIVTADVVRGLQELAPLKAVYGNMDLPEVRAILADREILEAEGKQIGIVHGSGGPWGLEARVKALFPQAHAIIFGHSHQSFNRVIDGVLLFNPGRASQSYGIIEIDGSFKARIYEGYY